VTPLPLVLAWLVGSNVATATAAACACDTLATRRGARRVRERTLWALRLAGGVGGAWLVSFGLRHRTQHRSVWVVQSVTTVPWVRLLLPGLAA
jgi:uncharacterized membrane protein YsdA (DUF1294 family)